MSTKQKMSSTGVIICVFCSLSVAVHAEPNISSVENDGDTVILNGEQFGTNSLDIAVVDTIDNRMVTEGSESRYSLDYEGFWKNLGGTWADPLTAKTGSGPLGNTSNKVYFGREKTNNGWPSLMEGKTNRSLYVSWWYKPSKSPSDEGGSNKFIRIWDENDGDHTRISWTQMHLVHGPNMEKVSWSGWGGEAGQWNLMEIYVDSDDGSIQSWVNGDLTHDVDDFEKMDSESGLTIALIGFDPSISSKYPNIETSIDDLYFSTSRARVVASKEDSWSEAKKENFAMLPVNWKDDQVKVKLTDKISRNVNDYYFYVIDDQGSSNTTGVSVCAECPETVDSLRVE